MTDSLLPVPDNPVVKFFTDLIVQDWALKLILGPLFTAFIYGVLWIFAKQGQPIEPAKRKWFFAAFLLLSVLLIHGVTSAYRQLAGIGRSEPDFTCELLSDPIIGEDAANPKITTVLYPISILNRGEPSITRNWVCTIDLGNNQSATATANRYPMTVYLPDGKGGHSPAPSAQYLPNTTLENRLEKNTQKTGWAYFTFPTVSSADADRPGVKLTLQFEDAAGKKTISRFTIPLNYKTQIYRNPTTNAALPKPPPSGDNASSQRAVAPDAAPGSFLARRSGPLRP